LCPAFANFVSAALKSRLHPLAVKILQAGGLAYICKKHPVQQTLEQYDEVTGRCRDLFLKKNEDYGTAWRVLRTTSLTDQLYIKAKRIRTIEERGRQEVEDDAASEYAGLVNYGIMALIQLSLGTAVSLMTPTDQLEVLYNNQLKKARELMMAKNHDYGEVWREMRISSLTDLILMKLLRIKQIEDNQGVTQVSEGLEANYLDIVNYAAFALIRLGEAKVKNNAS